MPKNFLRRAKLGPTKNYPNEIKKMSKCVFSNNLLRDKVSLESMGKFSLIQGELVRGSLIQEILWVANLIKQNKDVINKFILKQEVFEDAVIQKEYENALSILKEIEEEHGYSMWLVEAKIALLQVNEGLDAQKNFIISMYNRRKSNESFDEVFYLSYLVSQRNEPLLKTDNFIKNITKAILGDDDPNESNNGLWLLVRYFVLGKNIYSANEIAFLLSWTQTLSIYDLYRCFVYSIINLVFDNEIEDVETNILIRCLQGIKDKRIDNIISFVENGYNGFEEINTESINFNNKLHIEFLSHSFDESKELKSDHLICEFIKKIRNVFQVNSSRNDSFEWLQKNYMNFKHINSIHILFDICNILEKSPNNQKNAFFTTLLSDNRESLYALKETEKYGLKVYFNDSYYSSLYKDICIIYDANIYNSKLIEKFYETLLEGNLLLKDIFCTVAQIKDYCMENIPSKAFKTAVDLYLENENYVDILPLEDLVKDRKWLFYKNIDNQYDPAIIIYLYTHKYNKNDKQWFNMKLCCQTFIDSQGLDNHHELDANHFNNDPKRAAFFLENICIPETLEIDTNRYMSNRALLDERIKICNKILSIKENSQIKQELEEITKKIAIIDGVQTVENSGVTVNFKGFRLVAIEKVKDNFIRFHAFLDAGIKQKSSLSTKGMTDIQYNPNEESDRIFIDLLQDLIDIFLTHPEYGLDYYLSMRIRHGRFIGVLRGPLEREKLITKYSSSENRYMENEYWKEIYEPHLSAHHMDVLLEELSRFSKQFDILVTGYVKEIIQIKGSIKPLGQYNIWITEHLMEEMRKHRDFEVFIKQAFDYFFIMIEICSKQIQQKIKTELAENIRELIFQLQEKITPFISPHIGYVANNILDRLNHLRTDIDGAIKHVSSWFETSTFEKQDIRFFTFTNLVEIGLARTKQSRLDFSPEVTYTLDLDVNGEEILAFEPDLVPAFSDFFSILFDNISDHSGLGNDVAVNITANKTKLIDNKIKFHLEVRNEALISNEKLIAVDKIKDDMRNDRIRSVQEGHSGYHKIKAMEMINDLDFGFDDNEFYTKITLTLEYTGQIKGIDEENYSGIYIN